MTPCAGSRHLGSSRKRAARGESFYAAPECYPIEILRWALWRKGATVAARWYVLQSKVHKEEVLWQRLRAKGYEVLYPRLFVHQKKTRSLKIKPYFPGYLFVRLNLEQVGVSSFQWMPDAVGLISLGDKPASIPDQYIQAIQDYLKEIAALEERLLVGFDEGEQLIANECILFPSLSVKTIRVDSFNSSYRAILDAHISGKERVRALYQLLRDKATLTSETNPAP